jgi:hypothetical protein
MHQDLGSGLKSDKIPRDQMKRTAIGYSSLRCSVNVIEQQFKSVKKEAMLPFNARCSQAARHPCIHRIYRSALRFYADVLLLVDCPQTSSKNETFSPQSMEVR